MSKSKELQCVIRLEDLEKIRAYCLYEKISVSALLRTALYQYLRGRGVKFEGDESMGAFKGDNIQKLNTGNT